MASKEIEEQEESLKLIKFDAYLDGTTVHPMKWDGCFEDIQKKQYRNFRVVQIVDPVEFYLEYVPSTPCVTSTHQQLQDFYNNEANRQDYRVRTPIAYKGRIYVYYDSIEGTWNRVRVLKNGYPYTKTEAFSLDQDYTVSISYEDLVELYADLYCWSPWAIRGYFPNVKPVSDEWNWSQETISALERICQPDKIFHGVVLERQVIQAESWDDPESQLSQINQPQLCIGVILIEKSPTVKKSVQEILIEDGFMEPARVCDDVTTVEHSQLEILNEL